MSKKKRSKILATLLCATTMAAFYVSPRLVYAESLYYTDDDTVTTNGGGNTAITGIEGLESITFGVAGGQTASVKLTADFDYSGLRAEGAFSAKELFVDVVNAADATDTHNRYSLQNVLGVERTGTGENGSTQIEMVNNQGGMEITNKTINILDGTAVFSTDEKSQYDISFDGSFNSNQGMTVGTNFVLDSTGKISKVNGIDVQGALTTTGTINSMTIGNNQVNGVTMLNSNVTANTITGIDITDGTYHLTQIGSSVTALNEKTAGMSYSNGTTTFSGPVTAYAGITTMQISNGSDTFTVADAKEVIDAVNDRDEGLEATYDIATKNKTDIQTLNSTVSTFDERITGNTNNITALGQRVTTAEGEIDTLQTTVGEHDTAISGLSTRVDTAESNITTLTGNVTDLSGRVKTAEGEIDTLQTTVGEHDTAIGSLDTRVDNAETDITALEIKTHNISTDGNSITNLTNLSTANLTATTGTIGSVTFTGSKATGLTNIAGDSVTVAGTAISNGSFNSVNIGVDRDSHATFNGVSIYKDSDGHYNVGTIDLNDLTGSGSGGTVDGIVRTDNTPQDKEDNDYTTTIEGNLEVRTDGTITQRNGDFAVSADGTVTGEDFVIEGTGTTLSDVAGNVTTLTGRVGTAETEINNLQTTVGDENSGLVQSVNTLNSKTVNLSADGSTLTGMTNITTNTFTATSGSIGSIGFSGNNLTNVASIGGVDNTVTVAGTAISNGSFNGVNIGVDRDSHATFNGVSIYKDANDYIVGDVNISDLKGVSGTEIEGIKRTSNTGGGFTTTIEENLAVSTDGTIKQTKGTFAVDAEGTVTGKDFVINGGTSLSTVAQATTGMTYTAGNTTAEGVTSFDHSVHATNFTTDSADLNKLSETVGDANSGLVQNVNDLNTKTTNLSADGSTLTDMTNIESAAGTIGGMTFATVNGMKTIGSADDTITVAGAEITSNSFNNVEIYQNDENSHYFVGDVDVSALQSGSAEITNKLRGITYSSDDPDDLNNYTMTFAEHFSVSTSGEFTFKDGTGKEYHLDDLINTVDVGDLDKIKDLAGRVDNLEDKTTGIEFNKETGETTISHMNGTDTDTDGVNDTFTKGDNFFAVNKDGISANGDTFVRGDGQTSGGGTGGGTGTNTSDHFVDGDQTVGGSQFVVGDGNFNGSVSVGAGEDVFIDSNGNDTLDDGEISLSGVNSKVEGISVKVDGIGDVSSVNENIAGDSDDDGTNDLAGAVNNEYQQRVEADNALNERINSIDNRMGELEDRIDKVGAMAAAIANLRTMGYDPAAPTEVAVGIGQYRNETGAALGLFHYPNRDFMLSLSVSTSGDEVMGGIGATWKFGRKSPEKVAAEKAEKAREAKLQKAEAIKEAARLKKIEAQQERHAKLAAQKTATK